jgi:2-methylaconitate cis-trans-isomerase PrpF
MRKGLFPTGNKKDKLDIPGLGTVTVSVTDVVNPCAFIRAEELGLVGDEISKDMTKETYERMDAIRSMVAKLLGLKDWDLQENKDPTPFLVFVSPARDYINHLTGETIKGEAVDFLSRAYFLGGIHQTHPGSISCVTGATAKLPGTVVYETSRQNAGGAVRIGHPGGVIDVEAEAGKDEAGNDAITKVMYGRTARRIMDGIVYVPKTVFDREA